MAAITSEAIRSRVHVRTWAMLSGLVGLFTVAVMVPSVLLLAVLIA